MPVLNGCCGVTVLVAPATSFSCLFADSDAGAPPARSEDAAGLCPPGLLLSSVCVAALTHVLGQILSFIVWVVGTQGDVLK